ncbi:MAG: hypothetical protein WAO20_17465 [Acidobacteriota bacterium]
MMNRILEQGSVGAKVCRARKVKGAVLPTYCGDHWVVSRDAHDLDSTRPAARQERILCHWPTEDEPRVLSWQAFASATAEKNRENHDN